MSTIAPIVLFAYRRPEHTARCLATLAANPEAPATDLTAVVDGPRNAAERPAVEETQRVLRAATGFASVRIVERERNLGLAANVSGGVTETLAQRGRVIVVEDDLEVSPAFLAFMNKGLTIYAREERVAAIHGYVYPTGRALPSSFFLRGADCWGWATWERAWKHYDSDAGGLAERMLRCEWRREFDFDGAYPYRRMLRDAAAGRVDSWAVRWYASAFLDGMYTLYPGVSLVSNTGHDGTGHRTATMRYDTPLSLEVPQFEKMSPATNQAAYAAFHDYFLSLRPSFATRALRRIRDLKG